MELCVVITNCRGAISAAQILILYTVCSAVLIDYHYTQHYTASQKDPFVYTLVTLKHGNRFWWFFWQTYIQPNRPPTRYSLKITGRSSRCASPRLWNQLPDSFRQPLPHSSLPDSSLLYHQSRQLLICFIIVTLTIHHSFTLSFQA